MLKIFAIDPKICQTLEWFRYCTEHCQPSQGRAIADLPYNQWYENAFAIIQDLKLSPLEEKSLKRRLDLVRAQLVHRPGTKTVEAWNTPSGLAITRSPGEFVNAILPMLRVASNIHFLDRYFSVDANRLFTQNYTQIIQDLASYCDSFPSLTIHCCPDENDIPDSGYFEDELNKHYAPLIPIGKSVKVFLWQIKQGITIESGGHPFHNRYVLSNHCGVIAGYGTDSAKTVTNSPDVLQIVDHKIYLELWNQIRDETFPMMCLDDDYKFEIESTKDT